MTAFRPRRQNDQKAGGHSGSKKNKTPGCVEQRAAPRFQALCVGAGMNFECDTEGCHTTVKGTTGSGHSRKMGTVSGFFRTAQVCQDGGLQSQQKNISQEIRRRGVSGRVWDQSLITKWNLRDGAAPTPTPPPICPGATMPALVGRRTKTIAKTTQVTDKRKSGRS